MLNLHPPFRWATEADRDAITALAGKSAPGAEAVVAEEGGRILAVLSGRPSGESWRVEALAVADGHAAELGPRLLRLADALAAEDELGAVALKPDILAQDLRVLLEEEGFRSAEGDPGLMVRPVVPQG